MVKQLKNAKKIKDVVKSNQSKLNFMKFIKTQILSYVSINLLLAFEEMVKAYDKCKKLIEKDGHFKQYIRAIAELEQFINEVT